MEKEKNTPNTKKTYVVPELKDLGKVGEITNTTGTGAGTDQGSYAS